MKITSHVSDSSVNFKLNSIPLRCHKLARTMQDKQKLAPVDFMLQRVQAEKKTLQEQTKRTISIPIGRTLKNAFIITSITNVIKMNLQCGTHLRLPCTLHRYTKSEFVLLSVSYTTMFQLLDRGAVVRLTDAMRRILRIDDVKPSLVLG